MSTNDDSVESALHPSKQTGTVREGEDTSTRKSPRGVSAVCATPLDQALKDRPEILQMGQHAIHSYIERNSPFHVQKATAMNIFSISVSEGGRIMDACNLAAKYTGFNPAVVRRWAESVFRDFFGAVSNIDDVDDETLEAELISSTPNGTHSSTMKPSCWKPQNM